MAHLLPFILRGKNLVGANHFVRHQTKTLAAMAIMVGFSLPSIAFFLSALLIFNVHF